MVQFETVVAHVGAHKTGTSSLQDSLVKKSDEFLRHDIAVWRRWDFTKAITWPYIINRRGDVPDDTLKALVPDRAKHLLISDEDILGICNIRGDKCLYPNAAGNVSKLFEIFPAKRYELVLTVRELEKFAVSVYIQRLKVGATPSAQDFFADVYALRLQWSELILRLAEAVPDNCRIHVLNHDYEINPRLVSLFANFLKTDLGTFEFARETNSSYGLAAIEIARAGNRVLKESEDRKKLRQFLQQNFPKQKGEVLDIIPVGIKDALAFGWQLDRERLATLNAPNVMLHDSF
ncbi:hypothetical protein [Celeribacter halophilus]|uniref:hypothetical protein n=1 Tax=Celeribacter halophilus TaxID=576117 RepID=UPI003A92D41E